MFLQSIIIYQLNHFSEIKFKKKTKKLHVVEKLPHLFESVRDFSLHTDNKKRRKDSIAAHD